jgi:hypothetical protein
MIFVYGSSSIKERESGGDSSNVHLLKAFLAISESKASIIYIS